MDEKKTDENGVVDDVKDTVPSRNGDERGRGGQHRRSTRTHDRGGRVRLEGGGKCQEKAVP